MLGIVRCYHVGDVNEFSHAKSVEARRDAESDDAATRQVTGFEPPMTLQGKDS